MKRLGLAAPLAAVMVGVLGASAPLPAAAEIYGWVDASGSVTYSNLPPPKDAKVVDVIHEIPSTPESRAAAAAAHQAEMQALNDRVRQLEFEMQTQRQVSAPPPPPPSYTVASGPSYAPSYGPECDPEYFDCGVYDGPAYYTVGVPYWGYYRRGDRDHDRDGFRHRGDHGFNGFPHGNVPFHGGASFRGGAAHSSVASSGHASSGAGHR